MSEWVRCADCLPVWPAAENTSPLYLAWDSRNRCCIFAHRVRTDEGEVWAVAESGRKLITAWMPIPDPPNTVT